MKAVPDKGDWLHRSGAANVIVVGGGIAGLAAALRLCGAGCDVTVLESGSRLGGKAGADFADGRYEEHGMHLFPGWYVNTFRIARELGLESHFIPIRKIHELERGRFPKLRTLDRPTSVRSVIHNTILGGLFPWPEALSLYSAVLQLANEDQDPDVLDEMSLAEFFSARISDRCDVAACAEAIIPKLLGTPTSDLSAFVWQAAIRYWFRYRTPVFSILDGNLQETLIEPFARELRLRGCKILLNCRVENLISNGDRILGVTYDNGYSRFRQFAAACVVATPPDVTARLVSGHGSRIDSLSHSLRNLRVRPMGTMSLRLKRPIQHLPAEHIMLRNSKFALGLICVSQIWQGLAGCVLSINIGNVLPLLEIAEETAAKQVLEEIAEYLPINILRDVDGYYFRTNADAPLFLTNPGSWANRPAPGTTPVSGLYICGDFCRSAVRVASVEAAISTGLIAASHVLNSSASSEDVCLRPQEPRPAFVWLLDKGFRGVAALAIKFRTKCGLKIGQDVSASID